MKHQKRAAKSIHAKMNELEYTHQAAKWYYLLDGAWCKQWIDFIKEKSFELPPSYTTDTHIYDILKHGKLIRHLEDFWFLPEGKYLNRFNKSFKWGFLLKFEPDKDNQIDFYVTHKKINDANKEK